MHNHQDAISKYMYSDDSHYKYNQNQAYRLQNQGMIQQEQQQMEFQKQKYQNIEQQEALIQYYVYEDFQNLINLLYSYQVVKRHFKSQPRHPAIILSKNKIMLQLSISNSIHSDLYQTNKSYQDQNILKKEKENVKSMIKKMRNDIQNNDLDKESEAYLELYIKYSMGDHIEFKQFELQKMNQDYNFNQGVLDKIFPQISYVDEQIKSLRQRKYYNIPSVQQIKIKAQEYERLTENKLLINYPLNNYNYRSPQKQDYHNFQLENPKYQFNQFTNISQSLISSSSQTQKKQQY
ncbi:unnamed protein product (macronuclear) [Paramecium tetraurelia]|uniref:Uncharacterized protein n=1 Tax=Paramecium tetraurelia TaxID=5888 RepID=A0C243_PARTE|nr:uncharacterized protein GSPATT00034337001 [Paramecium tetraurelia]CAK64860.1 unnamed protein product [Paramecium tetraurelia]|eukprot:XP_001432257.1 hypothetical protein (macronuclear) [Paramecium tetraurelia strain d4-2]